MTARCDEIQEAVLNWRLGGSCLRPARFYLRLSGRPIARRGYMFAGPVPHFNHLAYILASFGRPTIARSQEDRQTN